ncbi:unnamed protein product, partial [Discosporangium mesarthrocarpum]
KNHCLAKVALGRMAFKNGRYTEAADHLDEAVRVKPLLPSAWFTLGVAHMRLGSWSGALQAFTRVVQQEPEEGE